MGPISRQDPGRFVQMPISAYTAHIRSDNIDLNYSGEFNYSLAQAPLRYALGTLKVDSDQSTQKKMVGFGTFE
jgi:hypothetical protein